MSHSGSNTDRIAALEATVDEQSRDIDTLEASVAALEAKIHETEGYRDRYQELETKFASFEADAAQRTAAETDRIVELERKLAAIEAEADRRIAADANQRLTTGERTATREGVPTQQDTAADLASLDAWLIAQTGVSLEYQLQRMCSQFYGNPLMPPS